jgi:hypothetical protein
VREFYGYNKYSHMKRDKIIYWAATGMLAAGMGMSAFMYLSKNAQLIESFQQLGYPLYFVSLLGLAKLSGAAILLAPVHEKLKEWAYAGFVFTFGGAIWTHVATGTPWLSPAVFLVVLIVSYVFHLRVKAGTKIQGTKSPTPAFG